MQQNTQSSRISLKSTLEMPAARILGIESSCDETAAAVVENGRTIISNLVASQVDLHAQFGGVFPEVASRQHIRTIYTIIDQTLQQAHIRLGDIDAIAVTRGPGLPGSLVVGLNLAKGLALAGGVPLIGVNHLEGHVYSAWLDWPLTLHRPGGASGSDEHLELKPQPRFPLLALIVSGGHTELVLMTDHLQYKRLGATLDDAAGEAFDKVARLLGLAYPGGPSIQLAAESGNPTAFNFPRAKLEGTWNFSFSGLKTAVLNTVNQIKKDNLSAELRRPLPVADLAASFQMAVVEVLVQKTLQAADTFQAAEILVAGGVSANRLLRNTILQRSPIPVHIPHISLCTDNAAMIAGAGYYRFVTGQRDAQDMDILPNWPLTTPD